MAKIKSFPQCNFILRAPPTQPDLQDLPCFRHTRGVISCWSLTQPELNEVARTSTIWLHVFGHTLPPVSITGVTPFRKGNGHA